MAHDVFISHSSKDKPLADAVCAALEQDGIRCWITPRDVMPGADWGAAIAEAIRQSRVVLLVFTANANESHQIKREVECAVSAEVTIVPLRLEQIEPTESFEYFLGNIHWLDAWTPPLEANLRMVVEKLGAILNQPRPAEPRRPTERAHAPTAAKRRRAAMLAGCRGRAGHRRKPPFLVGASWSGRGRTPCDR